MIASHLVLVLAVFAQAPSDEQKILAKINDLRTEDPAARRLAIEGLLEDGAPAVSAALSMLGDERPELERQVNDLVRQLADKNWKTRDAAQRALAAVGRRGRPWLEKHVDSPDPEVAWRVKAALAEIEESEKAEAGRENLRSAGLCEFLGRAGDPKAAGPLMRLLEGLAGDGPPAEPQKVLAIRLVEALGRLRPGLSAPQADAAAEIAFRMLGACRDRRLSAVLVRTLGRLRSGIVVTSLIAMLKDPGSPDVHLKGLTLRALMAIGDARGVAAIIAALEADEIYLRYGALEVLAEAADTDFGIDPREAPDRGKIQAARQWWEKKYGKAWTE